jgi:hypothetical protein
MCLVVGFWESDGDEGPRGTSELISMGFGAPRLVSHGC